MRTAAVILIAAAALILALPGAYAGDDESSLPPDKPAASHSSVRQESLELPGLTACHQCEWRPHVHQQAAPEQCGTTPDGAAKIGQFECGFSPDCERVCNFVSCVR
jgi:hypothetical protein